MQSAITLLPIASDPTQVAASLPKRDMTQAPNVSGCCVMTFTDLRFTTLHETLQSRVLEAMVHEVPLPELMTLICKEVERLAPDVIATVLRTDASGRLCVLAAPSLPPKLSLIIDGTPIGPEIGSCGTAAYRGETVVVTDIASDPLWRDYHTLFTPAGIRACLASPIKNHEGQVVGTFTFYFQAARSPSKLHQRLVDVCLQLCTLAMEREQTQNRIHQLAYYDPLTQLPNRSRFSACAQQLLKDSECAALLFIDLDRFKLINERQGHAAGDALLCEIANRLRRHLDAQGLVSRLSGDEFALLLPGYTATQAIAMAEQLLGSIAQAFIHQGMQHLPQARIGIALYPEDGSDIPELLRHADQAMQAAKKQPSSNWCRFSSQLSELANERVAMEHDLRQAIAQGQLHLHFQPQVLSQATGRLHGVEALARWNHPEWGAVPPARFIAVAEEAGLIQDFTRWLLDAACTQMAYWRARQLPVPQLAINLSARNFYDPQLAEQVRAALARHGLQAQDLVLEITESVMLDASTATLTNLQALKAMGLQLSLDDFGTGYSSLSYLHRLPISELKLDQSFVQDLQSSPAATALTHSVLSIARSLGMKMVAEGVETREQCEWLQSHHCDVMQGYLFCRPVSATELEQWLRAQAAVAVEVEGPALPHS